MNPPRSLFRTVALSLGLLCGTATAQDFDGQVAQDPRAGLAIYDFHFDGPPRGFAVLFAGLWTMPRPIPLPGIGIFELDPLLNLNLATLVLDAKGDGNLKFSLPLSIANHGLVYQPLFIDPTLNLRLIYTLGFDVALQPTNPPTTFSGKWSSKDGQYCFELAPVQQNDDISVMVGTQRVFAGKASKNGQFQGCFRHPGPFHKGETVQVFKNNALVKKFTR